MTVSYAERVQLTVEEQLARAEANALFKDGDVAAASAAYESALASTRLPENRLALLSNLGLCQLRLGEASAALGWLSQTASLGQACLESPSLAVKACARRLEACRSLDDASGARAAVADAAFYRRLALARGGKFEGLELPPADAAEAVTSLLMAVGAAEDEGGLARVSAALERAKAESCDEDGMNALALSIHIEAMRPALAGALLGLLLESGAPPDCRHEGGRTALMLAANEGRLDLCTALLDAGASAACTDGLGMTPLHAACVDLALAVEREEASLAAECTACVSLLLARGAPLSAVSTDGETALDLCKAQQAQGHEMARQVAALLQEAH